VGGRSAMATQAFAAAGWDAYNLSGGIVSWVAAGLPIEGHVADH
jgi:rhodanese-related sulfurtransferase